MLMFGTLTVATAISIPIFVVMGLCSAAVLYARGIDLISLPQTVFETLDSFILLALPFYVLAGNLMRRGGIAVRLVTVAIALTRWLRGGLGSASVLACMFFCTMSGSSSATTAAIGRTMIPALEKRGYPKPFATALVASGGELGAILPPSLPMIVYGLVTNVSIGALFVAGIIPGIVIGASLIATVCVTARVKGFDKGERISLQQWGSDSLNAARDAFWALIMPLIILGGIYSGVFTAVEASVVAVGYGLFVGLFIYREIKWRDLITIFNESAVTTSIIMMIVAFAGLFGYVLAIEQVPQKLGRFIGEIAHDPVTFLLLVNVLLFVAGTFMEAAATILILGPILAPIAAGYGVHPAHFGMIMIVNIATGMITPPVAINLSIASQISGVRMDDLWRPLMIFLFVLTIDVLLITFVPALSLAFLP